ncbi:glycoside hydrolase family 13 protein [Nocardioides jiangxiensis]|uniref:Glycoside hydrolase family 13 protein n=1 Tax=Nocardioides jiangxiensis TaxID=3064524 RepID=A0ABT9B0Y1_9ACTN|nr:glycoside hydrolase family 13 protein [Nocardioides sp. WY-20]MDO7868372.1 glycoside hydrolase family 13 protein [Nocardioides sp. WY-20]
MLQSTTTAPVTLTGPDDVAPEHGPWWADAVVYQVYIRSFADGDGDGIGDIAGLRSKIPYLAELGVDAIWINPWYPSPQADAGYDVADYRDIEPAYGTLVEADLLIAEAHAAGLRVILDIVPNHTSDQHAWFRAALAGDEAARARYIFRPGRGEAGELPPNNWESIFGGPAWRRTTDADGAPGDWYLHFFAPEQPDLNWENPEVRAEFEDILRFWFDRGVDGFRIDVAHALVKEEGLPDAGDHDPSAPHAYEHPGFDREGVHDIYRDWRRIADSYDPPRVFVAEAWVQSNERLARYLRPDELHTAFQFDFLRAPFDAGYMKEVVDDARAASALAGGTSTWVLSNHDVVRHVTRYARSQPDSMVESSWDRLRWADEKADLDLGVRRARAAALFILGLPGTVYVYQGEELGLPEVEDVPAEARQDPTFRQSDNGDVGRDGCRIPIPWGGDGAAAGFSPAGTTATPWLPQPEGWSAYSATDQEADPASVLHLYRRALRLRRAHLAGVTGFAWVHTSDDVAAFRHGDVEVWLNTGSIPVTLPAGEVLLASSPGAADGSLAPDSAAWLRRS